jgi:hypothetical protein
MIKRILIAVLALFAVAFILSWVLGGGFANIKAAVGHYRDPLKYGSIVDWFFQIGSTTGEAFQLPGTPSSYPTLTIPNDAKGPAASTTVYMTGSSEPQGVQ